MARRYDLRINQGETWQCTVPVFDADGEPLSMAGVTVRGQIRNSRAAGPALHTWASDGDNVTLATGEITLHVPAVASAAWTWTTGLYDVEIADAGGITRLLEGVVHVSPEITR